MGLSALLHLITVACDLLAVVKPIGSLVSVGNNILYYVGGSFELRILLGVGKKNFIDVSHNLDDFEDTNREFYETQSCYLNDKKIINQINSN